MASFKVFITTAHYGWPIGPAPRGLSSVDCFLHGMDRRKEWKRKSGGLSANVVSPASPANSISMNWFKAFWQKSTKPSTEGESVWDAAVQVSPRARQMLILAQKEAERRHHPFIGTEHVLLGLITLRQGVAINVLTGTGFDLERIRAAVEKVCNYGPEPEPVPNTPPSLTPRVKKALRLAQKEATLLNHTYVGTEHVLLGLLREEDNVAARILKGQGVSLAQMREHVLKELDPRFSPKEK